MTTVKGDVGAFPKVPIYRASLFNQSDTNQVSHRHPIYFYNKGNVQIMLRNSQTYDQLPFPRPNIYLSSSDRTCGMSVQVGCFNPADLVNVVPTDTDADGRVIDNGNNLYRFISVFKLAPVDHKQMYIYQDDVGYNGHAILTPYSDDQLVTQITRHNARLVGDWSTPQWHHMGYYRLRASHDSNTSPHQSDQSIQTIMHLLCSCVNDGGSGELLLLAHYLYELMDSSQFPSLGHVPPHVAKALIACLRSFIAIANVGQDAFTADTLCKTLLPQL